MRGISPLRVIVDSRLRTPPDAAILDEAAPTLIFHGDKAPRTRHKKLARNGVELFEVARGPEGLALDAILAELGRRNVVRLLVEGGGRLHGALLDQGIADAAAIFVAPLILGDGEGMSLAMGHARSRIEEARRLKSPRIRRFGEDVLVEGEL